MEHSKYDPRYPYGIREEDVIVPSPPNNPQSGEKVAEWSSGIRLIFVGTSWMKSFKLETSFGMKIDIFGSWDEAYRFAEIENLRILHHT